MTSLAQRSQRGPKTTPSPVITAAQTLAPAPPQGTALASRPTQAAPPREAGLGHQAPDT